MNPTTNDVSATMAENGDVRFRETFGHAPDPNEDTANWRAECAYLRSVLTEARAQIEYLHGKFQPTGSGNTVLTRIEEALK